MAIYNFVAITSLGTDLESICRIVLAFLLGAIIGLERERHGISAGIRTYGAIALGACVFGILSTNISGSDPARIAAQVVTGIGFLGGGIIFRQESHITGLTTAATLWATASIGLAISFGMYLISFVTTTLIFFLLYSSRLTWWKKISRK